MVKGKEGNTNDKKLGEIKGIVRIAGKDVKGQMPLKKALYQVKGVGRRYAGVCANVIHQEMGVSPLTQVGTLDDSQLSKIESIISSPLEYGIPRYMLNRRRDYATGEDKQLISNDLDFAVKQSIELDKKIKTWRGISHMYRKKVRGQRTRTSGRKGSSVGVVQKKMMPGKAAPAASKEKK
ncbi:MAG: 30S ribosomal protein S13 [Candidatus Micrarchaeia archaeon]